MSPPPSPTASPCPPSTFRRIHPPQTLRPFIEPALKLSAFDAGILLDHTPYPAYLGSFFDWQATSNHASFLYGVALRWSPDMSSRRWLHATKYF